MRVAMVLLYTASLRRGELVRRRLGDVDVRSGVLRDWFRCRRTPTENCVTTSVGAYVDPMMKARTRLCCVTPTRDVATVIPGLAQAIERLFVQADVHDGEGRTLRVHDARHSFALQALIGAYRRGCDVQTELPRLALYMGHVNIESTAYYVRFIPEIAAFASERFGQRFSHLIDGNVL